MGKALTQAAGSGDLYSVLLVVCVIIITMMTVFQWWRYREDVRRRERHDDLIEKRLSSGSEKMQRTDVRMERIESNYMRIESNMLTRGEFNEYCKAHDDLHRKLESTLVDLTRQIAEQRQSLVEAVLRVETKVHTLAEAISKHVVVPGGNRDKEDNA